MNILKEKGSGVYGILNLKNNNLYIGSSSNIYKRLLNHKKQLKKKTHENRFLQKDWNEFGSENFSAILIERSEQSLLQEREQYFLNTYSKTNKLYNIAMLAYSSKGIKRTEETKKKMSEWQKGICHRGIGYTHSEKTKEKIRQANTGYRHSEESKEKNRQAHLGTSMSEESRRKIADFQRTQVRSEETRRRMSESKKGTIVSESTREKLRQANLGKTISESNKEALRKANIGNKHCLGRKQTEEEKKRRSESMKAFRAKQRLEKEQQLQQAA